ncbi:MAG: family 10 glycosylhydrolase [Planctomycetes bacterium]|nr:family 10 glycosylhydrolase [Planctomycetota bacterium]
MNVRLTVFIFAFISAVSAAASAQDIIIDNGGSGFSVVSGTWTAGNSSSGKYGADYQYVATTTGAATAEVEWRPTITTAGEYEVAIQYPEGSNRATDATFVIDHANGTTTMNTNQTVNGAGAFRRIGIFSFSSGTSGRVALKNDGIAGAVVIADAVRFRPVTYATDEYRGIWISRFEWPSSNAQTAKNNIITAFDNAARGGFNSVVFQVRGQADVLYPSPNEVWSTLIGGSNPGFDPLRYALDEAHARGLELHAYFNTHVVWGSASAPSNTNHLYYAHCNPGDSAKQDWLIADSSGNPISSPVDGYLWMIPGHPDVQAYLRTQVMHLVRTYSDLDGIHFDRIRTPSPGYSHDSTTTARMSGDGNPGALGFADWTRDQITRFLRDTYAEVHSVNPNLQLSAAPLGLYTQSHYPGYPAGFQYSFDQCYQDAQGWLANRALDWIAPQVYWADGGNKPDFSDLVPDWVANANGRHIHAGFTGSSSSSASTNVSRAENEISAARSLGAQGTNYWSYGQAQTDDLFTALDTTRYALPAKVPTKSWLDSPTTGIIYGYVTDASNGGMIVDAQITRTGDTSASLSSGDGLYSFLDVAVGASTTITATKSGIGSAMVVVPALTAGEVRRVDIPISAPGSATRLSITTIPSSVNTGETFSVTVEVQDSTGAVISSDNRPVQLAIQSGSGALTGTTTGTTSSGAFTFSAALDTAGQVTLRVTDTSGTPLVFDERAITVNQTGTPPPPSGAVKIEFFGPPASVESGREFQLTVHVLDANSQIVSTGSSEITISASGLTGTLTGATTLTSNAGVARFTLTYGGTGAVTFTASETTSALTSATASVTFTAASTGGAGGTTPPATAPVAQRRSRGGFCATNPANTPEDTIQGLATIAFVIAILRILRGR